MIQLQLVGAEELAKTLATLSARVSRTVQREALVSGAEPMRRAMQARAPVEAGKPDLRDDMVISNARGLDAHEVSVAVGPSKAGFYGSFVELGTKFTAARPFARPAFDENLTTTVGIIGRALWTALAAAGVGRSATTSVPVQSGPGGGLL